MEQRPLWDHTDPTNVKFETCSSTENHQIRRCKEEDNMLRYCNGSLSFSTGTSDDEEGSAHRKKLARDPLSHRIIEKRRRDRMNSCLADLAALVPAQLARKARGRVEKTEIIEMAIRHIKHLHTIANQPPPAEPSERSSEQFRLGYQECLAECLHFLVELEGLYPSDPLCLQLASHLQKHCDNLITNSEIGNSPTTTLSESSLISTTTTNVVINNGNASLSASNSNNTSTLQTNQQHHYSRPTAAAASSPQLHSILSRPNSENRTRSSSINSKDQLLPLSPDETHQAHQEMTELRNNNVENEDNPRTPSPSPSVSNFVINGHSCSTFHGSYKFKNNIKQRFSAERGGRISPNESRLRHRSTNGIGDVANGVPVFALEPRGTYLPLCLPESLLEPYFKRLVPMDTNGPGIPQPLQYPVTISVNFRNYR